MSVTDKLLTLKEYCDRDNDAEKHYELVAGKLTEMPPESPQNAEIAIRLLLLFAQFVSPRLLRCKDTEIVVSGGRATVRLPDLMVLTEDLANDLYSNNRSTINIDMLPPALVVEVTSPGKANRDRDYRYKRCSAVRERMLASRRRRRSALRGCGVSPISDTEAIASKLLCSTGANAPFKKRSEYAARSIGEYWIVDPQENQITVLVLNNGLYEENIYRDDMAIASSLFPQLELTAEAIFANS
ncbi:MAG: Uma2 family endonuclease [Cyanobacteria bacterium J06600_6]